ncbi:MAG: hypothetical protein OJF47_002945 [Nitrospira sp.]|nr:MAG: hypothetical protein OJF47_002945 [Nitrospira sp.]
MKNFYESGGCWRRGVIGCKLVPKLNEQGHQAASSSMRKKHKEALR